MRIGLAYDLQTDPTDERQAEFDPPATLDAVSGALAALGHAPVRLGSADDVLGRPERLRDVELVFNLAEGRHGRCREAWMPTLLELLRIPYVGSDPLALSLGLDKVMSKRVALAEGIATPRWVNVDRPSLLAPVLPLALPVIVKPRFEGSGRGIDAGAVVRTREALAARVNRLYERCRQPALVEEFIGHGELTVLVIGNDPSTRPAFRRGSLEIALPAVQRPIDRATRLSCHVVTPVPSTAAGGPGQDTPWECPLTLDAALDGEARRIAVRMFEAIGCRDVARVDLRADEQGRLHFLEINPLPSFAPDGSFGLLAEHLGTTYTEMIGRVLDAACRRLGLPARGPRAAPQPAAPNHGRV